jgi:hypothetical protein
MCKKTALSYNALPQKCKCGQKMPVLGAKQGCQTKNLKKNP